MYSHLNRTKRAGRGIDRPFGQSWTGMRQRRGLGLMSGGQAAVFRAEGGRWRRSRGSREAEVEEGGTDKVRDEAAACSDAGDEAAACSEAGIEDGRQSGTTVSRATEEREHLRI
jgi:hypothetical protein